MTADQAREKSAEVKRRKGIEAAKDALAAIDEAVSKGEDNFVYIEQKMSDVAANYLRAQGFIVSPWKAGHKINWAGI